MTGRKAILDLLNRFGHFVSNDKVKQIHTGMKTSIAITTKLYPSNIREGSKAWIGIAWENIVINLETLSGAGSIHHTYGIDYQNISVDEEEGFAVDNSNYANKEYTEEFSSVTVNNRKRKITQI